MLAILRLLLDVNGQQARSTVAIDLRLPGERTCLPMRNFPGSIPQPRQDSLHEKNQVILAVVALEERERELPRFMKAIR